ncbi:MAG TPA: hypothetical protein VJ506_08085, partial [Candidatus Limnocylindrales bacterium]|nr:hypothetical protein [Candidatus Limnocylindrales bacterium]
MARHRAESSHASGAAAVAGPARVAVVGTGAWGTTLAILVARSEPVLLLARSAEKAATLAAERRTERLPGIEL